ncbi:hypothetical protein GCM10007049_14150 [Echinicola pacifica]|uniref:Uncharacterized protein n=1 Tax=Echinicola pacifica TaxID=346377 RepID=A0A918PUS8_9BACT|nr:hypothetical protein [Echinicola pacifica]GGZ22492.1 hypothetical protein GCM10007049_14150 [Echinicola pacifica]
MKDRVEKLLYRYYEGETTLEEEKELRRLLAQQEGYEEEKMFFLGLETIGSVEPVRDEKPFFKSKNIWWFRVAAVATVFLTFGWLIFEQQKRMAEEEAYANVMEAFALIHRNMNKGTSSLRSMEDIKYLNTTHEWFNMDQKYKNEEEK